MRHHIISIGISKHQSPFINNLQFAAKDALELLDLFETNIKDIGYKRHLVDSEATLAQIRSALGAELEQEVEEADSLLFFYSGHGTTAQADSNSLAHYLIPFDATPDFVNTSISVDYLKAALDRLPCRVKLVFIDSCFSGSINSKGYANPNKKALVLVKTFGNTVMGTGSVTFTACKDDEEAIEDLPRRNGLFTSELLAELSRDRSEDRFSITDIFTPVTENVVKRAKEEFRHTQTPTLNSHLEGVLYLPVFRKRKIITPHMIRPPRLSEQASAAISVPRISISDKELEAAINELVTLVSGGSQDSTLSQDIAFERFCGQLLKALKEDWERILVKPTPTAQAIADAVSEFEAAAHQIILLGSIVAVFGSEKQMEAYAEYSTEILEFGEHRSGLVALLSIPEIIIVDIIYSLGVVCFARGNLRPLSKFLGHRVFQREDIPPLPLFMLTHVHYCDALGGKATNVNEHVRALLESYPWIGVLAPRAEDRIMDLQLQVNFLLSLLLVHNGERFWPDFGRYYGDRLRKPLLQRLLYDSTFQSQVADLFGVKVTALLPSLRELLEEVVKRGLGGTGYFWESIKPGILMTFEERQALKDSNKGG